MSLFPNGHRIELAHRQYIVNVFAQIISFEFEHVHRPGIAPIQLGKGTVIGNPSIGIAMLRAELPTVATFNECMVFLTIALRPKKMCSVSSQ